MPERTEAEREEQMRTVAKQLRKPQGEFGMQLGQTMNQGNLLINRSAIDAVRLPDNGRILEIGMGNGFFASELLDLADGTRYVGCDYSPLMVAQATELNATLVESGRATFVHGEISKLPIDSNTFDVVITVNTLYFWSDPLLALANVQRALKPGGQLVLAIRPERVMRYYPFAKYDFAMYSDVAIKDLLSKAGFLQIELAEFEEPDRDIAGKSYAIATLVATAVTPVD
ncbi:MAG: class I SAM-dependent methyltransferase [Rhodothermales bacterium]|nr:class I SAM-dependent methyltransferase [Rhodothermales bacterium]